MRQSILKVAGSYGALDAVYAQLKKAEVEGMTEEDELELVNNAIDLLKQHAHKKQREMGNEKLSPEQAFSREYARDERFRTCVRKCQQLQAEITGTN